MFHKISLTIIEEDGERRQVQIEADALMAAIRQIVGQAITDYHNQVVVPWSNSSSVEPAQLSQQTAIVGGQQLGDDFEQGSLIVKTTYDLLEALKTFQAGDVIVIAPGTYTLPESAPVKKRGGLSGQGG